MTVSSQDATSSTSSKPGNSLSARRISSASPGSPSTPNPTVPSTASHGVGAVGVVTVGDAGDGGVDECEDAGVGAAAGVLGDDERGRTGHRHARPGHLARPGRRVPLHVRRQLVVATQPGRRTDRGRGRGRRSRTRRRGTPSSGAARRRRAGSGRRGSPVARRPRRGRRRRARHRGADCTHAGAVSTTTSSPVIAASIDPAYPPSSTDVAIDQRHGAIVLEREQRAPGPQRGRPSSPARPRRPRARRRRRRR